MAAGQTTGSSLHPACHCRQGGFYASGREDHRNALHVTFQDAAPDSWGRALMTRVLGGGLSEFDYLTRSDDHTRQGALRFLDDDMQPLSGLSPPVPRLVDLERLRALAHQFEHDPGGAEEAVLDLAGVAGSLGGARPKASCYRGGPAVDCEVHVARRPSCRGTCRDCHLEACRKVRTARS